MLEPDTRVVLLDQLRPPVGYRLEAAVGTTFTLQLSAALVPPLAFASHELRTRPDPIAALEAVRSCADRVDIFCQAGQIVIPNQASHLMAFLEPMVHPVRRPRANYLFHPKVWFLRYSSSEGPDAFRLICSSRNLVDSQAWDAVVSLDGVLGERPPGKRSAVASLLRQLPEWSLSALPRERRDRVLDLADRAERVVWTPPESVGEVRMHVYGVPRVKAVADFSGYRHLVVAPFCNEAGLDHVTGGNTQDVVVISRGEDLDKVDPSFLGKLRRPSDEAVLVLDPLAGLEPPEEATAGNADSIQPAAPPSELSGLHAKITIAERNNRACHVFIGSANATSAAYGGNVEFLVELIGRSKDLGVDSVLARGNDGKAALRDMLQPYRRRDTEIPEDGLAKLENLLRTVASITCRIHVETAKDGYRLRLLGDAPLEIPADHTLVLGLLTRPGVAHAATIGSSLDILFEGVALPDVTPFVTMRLTDGDGVTVGTIIHAPLDHDPEGRLDEVLARQVDTREKFLRFLALLLGLGDPAALWAAGEDGGGSGAWGSGFGGSTGLLELVLGALADRPKSLVDLDGLVRRLRASESGRRILPDGFEEFWMAVTAALAKLGGNE